MMKKVYIILLSGFICFSALADEKKCNLQEEGYYNLIQDFIHLVERKDKSQIAEIINYPLERPSPIKNIESKDSFIEYFGYLFDDDFIKQIAESDPCIDWQTVGWRGIAFNRGDIWVDYDGTVRSINHISVPEQRYLDDLSAKERAGLYSAIRDYDVDYITIKTNKFLVRIDSLKNGGYRYAAWSGDKLMSEKPDLILNNGTLVFDGNGGNRHFIFINGDYSYLVYENRIGTSEMLPYELVVEKQGKSILRQDAKSVNAFDYINQDNHDIVKRRTV